MPALMLRIEETQETFSSPKGRITIGRDPSCDLPVQSVMVSRTHAALFFKDGKWFAEDLNSRNGTAVNGQKLSIGEVRELSPNDTITLANQLVLTVLSLHTPLSDAEPFHDTQSGNVQHKAMHISQQPIRDSANSAFCQRVEDSEVRNFAVPGFTTPPEPAKPQKQSFLKSLFQKAPAADDIQFRAAAPATLSPGLYFTVKIMMHREDDFARADREEKTVADVVKSVSSSIFSAKKQELFRIRFQSPDIVIENAEVELCWNGKYCSGEVELFLPQDYDKKQLRLIGRVYSDIAVLTDLRLTLMIGVPQEQNLQFEKHALSSAFISYASQDRAEVAARIQGILLSRPDMDLFFDAESLRRGELWENRLYQEISNRDLFYLFWSRNAAQSEWVSKELTYALEQKGPLAVEPVPLEAPDVCPPPEALSDRHFNDWTLRYLSSGEKTHK